MVVLSFASPEVPLTEVDVFAAPPFAFEDVYRRAHRVELGERGDVGAWVASLADVIDMKRRAGRAKDLEDVDALERLARDREEAGGG